MKLTNTIRAAFVRAAMADVPRIDYDEQIRAEVLADAVSQLPAEVRALWENPKLRPWVTTDWLNIYRRSFNIPQKSHGVLDLSAGTLQRLKELVLQEEAQRAARTKLEDNLRAAAYSVTTRKALAALLPEFARYLPAETPPACRTVPALANLAADFAAAGWPKGGAA